MAYSRAVSTVDSMTHRHCLPARVPSEPRSAAVDANQPGQAAAANMLVSRAHAGLGEIQANAHARVEAALLNQLAVIRAALGEWNALNSQAAGFETYDAEADVRSLQSQMTERQSELGQAQQASRAAVDAIAALEAEASQLSAQGEQARRETAVRPHAERLKLKTAVARRGDPPSSRADDLIARRRSFSRAGPTDRTPQRSQNASRSSNRRSRSFVTVSPAFASGATRTRRRDQSPRCRSGRCAPDTDHRGRHAAQRRRSRGRGGSAHGLAQSAATKAASKATDAATKGQASVLAAAAAQAAADVQASRARGLTQYATVVRSAADDPFRLPNRATYSQRAGEAEKRSADAQKLAGELYKAAMDSFAVPAQLAGAQGQRPASRASIHSANNSVCSRAKRRCRPTNPPIMLRPHRPPTPRHRTIRPRSPRPGPSCSD